MPSSPTWSDVDASPSPGDTFGRTTVLPRREGDQRATEAPSGPRFDGLSELGRGGLGVVLSARDRDIGRRVAIKQLRPDRRSPAALLRFAEEVRTVGTLDHPNIVPIHDVGVDAEGSPYFVMKHVDGVTLQEVLDQLRAANPEAHGHWTFTRRIEVFRKVLEAVGFAHDRGVVHRDIKPENIMIGSHGEVHVLDWGIAQRRGVPDLPAGEGDEAPARVTQTRAGAIIGTPAYMSPEQSRGEPIDTRSDIYSLGVVLHELLGLTHYLDDIDDLEELLKGVQQREAPGLTVLSVPGQSTVAPHLHWLAKGALAKDPADRYPDIATWLDRIDGVAEGDIPVQCPFTLQKHWVAKLSSSMDAHPVLWTFLFLGAATAAMVALGMTAVFGFTAGALLI